MWSVPRERSEMDMRLDQGRAVLPSPLPRILQELVLSLSWASTGGHKGGKGSILTLEVFLVALSVSTMQCGVI